MKRTGTTHLELADLCRQLALLLHAGVSAGDGLSLLAEETPAKGRRAQLETMARQVDEGQALSDALDAAGGFPTYVTGLVRVGERSGRTEEALNALADYYEGRDRMDRRLRSALLYPAILLVLMLVVIVVLLTRVLPVFDQVYASLGGSLTGVAGGLLRLGRALDAALPVLCVLLALAAVGLAAFAVSGRFRDWLLGAWRRHWGDRGVSRRLNDARFAQSMAMGLGSGLPVEEALTLTAYLGEDVPAAAERCRACKTLLDRGCALTDALKQADMLPAGACRLLELGLRGGTGDAAMAEIARRLTEEAEDALELRTAQVEPALVLLSSLLVGAVLLAVMLPLMHIMAAIG